MRKAAPVSAVLALVVVVFLLLPKGPLDALDAAAAAARIPPAVVEVAAAAAADDEVRPRTDEVAVSVAKRR